MFKLRLDRDGKHKIERLGLRLSGVRHVTCMQLGQIDHESIPNIPKSKITFGFSKEIRSYRFIHDSTPFIQVNLKAQK